MSLIQLLTIVHIIFLTSFFICCDNYHNNNTEVSSWYWHQGRCEVINNGSHDLFAHALTLRFISTWHKTMGGLPRGKGLIKGGNFKSRIKVIWVNCNSKELLQKGSKFFCNYFRKDLNFFVIFFAKAVDCRNEVGLNQALVKNK